MGLTWECLDLDNGTLTIKQQLRREQHKDGQFYFSKPKNNKTRTLTLAPAVVKLFRLQKLEQNGKRLKAGKSWTEKDLVFSNEVGGFLSHRVIYRCFKELVKEIGTPSTRFHDGCIKIGLNQKQPHSKGGTDLVLFLFYNHKGGNK